jgi:hypothetical protein
MSLPLFSPQGRRALTTLLNAPDIILGKLRGLGLSGIFL